MILALLLIGFASVMGLPIDIQHSAYDPNPRTFYGLYNRNSTQEIVESQGITNQDKLQVFAKITKTQSDNPEKMNEMFNRTIYIKDIADSVLPIEKLRKNIFNCFEANVNIKTKDNLTISEKLAISKNCFTRVSNDEVEKMSSFLEKWMEWSDEFGAIYNPISDMFFNYYRRVDVEAIIYKDGLTTEEKKAEISELIKNDKNMDFLEKVFFDTYYTTVAESLYSASSLMKNMDTLNSMAADLQKFVEKYDSHANQTATTPY